MIHVFVGTDRFQHKAGAEAALEASILANTSADVEIHWMRAGPPGHPLTSPGFEIAPTAQPGCWNVRRPIDDAWPKRGWGTPFSAFRLAIPELMGFSGKAIYLDADMIVLGDIQELLDYPSRAPWLCNPANRTDVSVIDCGAFSKLSWWPSIDKMKPRITLPDGRRALKAHGLMDESLSWEWNDCEGKLFHEGRPSKLIHFTSVPHQPYRPYPRVRYLPHPYPDVVAEWEKWRQFALSR